MHDERNYPTLKLLRCRECKNVFVAGMGGGVECPECSSNQAGPLGSGDNERDNAGSEAKEGG